MRNAKYILTLTFILSTLLLQAQTLRNEGKMNVSGGSLVIKGNYQNESAGSITLDGKITVSGNWINNGSTNVIDNPDTNGEVVFNGTGTQTIGGTANVFDFEKLTINSGSLTQVVAGKGVTAYGACTFTSPLVLKASTSINAFHPIIATFINESTVSGNITMEFPYTSTGSSAAGPGRGMYFSSPISNATASIFNVAGGANLIWYWNEATNAYVKVTQNTNPLTSGRGYVLRSAISSTYNFTGQPNVASSFATNNIPLGQFYLFGNPYPSVINWDAVSKTNLSSSIWYKTCTQTGSMLVDTWNSTSGIGTNNNGIVPVNGKVGPLQSFWVQCNSSGSTGAINLSSNNRTHNSGSTTILKSGQTDRSLIRLDLYTGESKDEAVFVESSAAQDVFDPWDSEKMFQKDGKRAEIYSLSFGNEKKNLVIQSVKQTAADKSIKLGLYTGVTGSYKFVADLTASTRTGNVFLEDTKLGTMQDLFVNPEYTFSSDAVNDTSRFILHFYKAPVVKVKNSITVCSSEVVDLTASLVAEGSDPGLSYSYWTNSAVTMPYATPTNASTGTYYIKAVASNGLYVIAGPVNVTINPVPNIVINNISDLTDQESIDLTDGQIIAGSTEGLLYSYWMNAGATIPCSDPQFAKQGQYYIKGTFETTGCYSVVGPIQIKSASSTTGIDAGKKDDLLIYANGSQIYIRNCAINSYIRIFDMLGRQQYSGISASDNEVIDSGLKTGYYLVKIENGLNVNVKKVFIGNGNN